MSLSNGNSAGRYLQLLEEKRKTQNNGHQQLFFFFFLYLQLSEKSVPCVVFTNSIKIHEICSRALFGPGKVRPASFQIS